MKIEESLDRYMEGMRKEHLRIESFASEVFDKLGLNGPRSKDVVCSSGTTALYVTYFADSELNRSDGEATGLRVLFDVEDRNGMTVRLSAFFRSKPTFDLTGVRVIECEGVENPDHRDLLEGQVRGKYKGSHIKHETTELRDQEAVKLLSQFVKDTCKLLCRLHLRPPRGQSDTPHVDGSALLGKPPNRV